MGVHRIISYNMHVVAGATISANTHTHTHMKRQLHKNIERHEIALPEAAVGLLDERCF